MHGMHDELFNSGLAPVPNNPDHEPELRYVYATDFRLPDGGRWRYIGLGIVHQSSGQTLPLTRSWNRTYLMVGPELDDRFHLTGRIWHRLKEDLEDDDNPRSAITWARELRPLEQLRFDRAQQTCGTAARFVPPRTNEGHRRSG